MIMGLVAALAAPVLFHVDFSRHAPGPYNRATAARDFNGPPWMDGLDEGLAEIVPGRCNDVLRIHYMAGRTGGGVILPVKLPRSYQALYLAYWVRFPPGFDFVKEGKLSGLCGGACNSGGKRASGSDGWSSRIIWRGNKAAQYVYAADQQGDYGDIHLWNEGRNELTTGVWHHVQTWVSMNQSGQSDGRIVSWLDGQTALSLDHVRFRDTAALAIDSFRFETFFGGGTPDFAPSAAQYADFDDITVSEQPITAKACPAH